MASATTFSVAANAKSAEQNTGTYQYVGKGRITLASRSSATGLNCTLSVNGVPVVDDSPHSFFGTTGGLSVNDHVIASQVVSGGKASLTYRNTTAGALTVDYVLLFEPMK